MEYKTKDRNTTGYISWLRLHELGLDCREWCASGVDEAKKEKATTQRMPGTRGAPKSRPPTHQSRHFPLSRASRGTELVVPLPTILLRGQSEGQTVVRPVHRPHHHPLDPQDEAISHTHRRRHCRTKTEYIDTAARVRGVEDKTMGVPSGRTRAMCPAPAPSGRGRCVVCAVSGCLGGRKVACSNTTAGATACGTRATRRDSTRVAGGRPVVRRPASASPSQTTRGPPAGRREDAGVEGSLNGAGCTRARNETLRLRLPSRTTLAVRFAVARRLVWGRRVSTAHRSSA